MLSRRRQRLYILVVNLYVLHDEIEKQQNIDQDLILSYSFIETFKT